MKKTSAYDVAIVGGGLIGSSIAFELAAAKLRVIVLDRQAPGLEASWAAAGMLSPAPDGPPAVQLVPLALESLALYPSFVARVEEESGQTTNFVSAGGLEIFYSIHGEAERDAQIAEYRRLGAAIEPITLEAARNIESLINPKASAAAWFPGEARIDPRLLTAAVISAAQRRGVEMRSGVEVASLLRESNRCTGVMANNEKIAAQHVIVAAGCFSGGIALDSETVARFAPTIPIRGQMIALRPSGFAMRHVVRSERGYLVPRADGRIIAGSTLEDAGFEKRVTAAGMHKILGAALEMIPALAEAAIIETWSGLRPGTPDQLPILGPAEIEGLLIATGHYRNGILLAPVTAKILADYVLTGESASNAAIFSPLRFQQGNRHATTARD
ncbi:MAG: glycine oxidase ThiO [Candidatus Acidiferrales bacterium]